MNISFSLSQAFLDDIFGPIEDFFENDYYQAAAYLLETLEVKDDH